MARKARKKGRSGIYHVILRGNDRQDLFFNDDDRNYFLKKLNRYIEETELKLYAFCLMNNHVHLLIGNADKNMPLFVKKLACSYAYYFNHKYDRVGHLFHGRYKSEPVDTDEYFKTVYRYILQNPEKQGLDSSISYRWASLNWEGRFKNLDNIYPVGLFGSDEERRRFIFLKNNDHCMENMTENQPGCSDDFVGEVISRLFDLEHARKLHELPKEVQKQNLNLLKRIGFSTNQLARITGFTRYFVKIA